MNKFSKIAKIKCGKISPFKNREEFPAIRYPDLPFHWLDTRESDVPR